MSGHDVNAALTAKNIVLPAASVPKASYVPFTKAGSLVFIAGQGPRWEGAMRFAGKVGVNVTIEQGMEAARLCALNIISHMQSACGGDLNKVAQIVRVAGLVNCLPDFTDHARVLNGASDLFLEVFGEAGRHARIATGAISLPSDMAVEVEAAFLLR